jgi:hypothetical protein
MDWSATVSLADLPRRASGMLALQSSHKNEGGRAFTRESSCRRSVLFMLRAACLLDIAVTFGSVAGLRMARACSTGESKYLSLVFVSAND